MKLKPLSEDRVKRIEARIEKTLKEQSGVLREQNARYHINVENDPIALKKLFGQLDGLYSPRNNADAVKEAPVNMRLLRKYASPTDEQRVRLVLTGAYGVGKTTALNFIQDHCRRHRDNQKWVFKIDCKSFTSPLNLVDMIIQSYFSSMSEKKQSGVQLYLTGLLSEDEYNHKVLLLIDSLEVLQLSPEHYQRILADIAHIAGKSHVDIVVGSRDNSVLVETFDRLHIQGFSVAGANRFIDNYFAGLTAYENNKFIDSLRSASGLEFPLKNPAILSVLCSTWKELNRIHFEIVGNLTNLHLFEAVDAKYLHSYLVNTARLSPYQSSQSPYIGIQKICALEILFLECLALTKFVSTNKSLDPLYAMSHETYTISNLLQLGVVTQNCQQAGQLEFIHPDFNDLYVAKFLATYLRKGKAIESSHHKIPEPQYTIDHIFSHITGQDADTLTNIDKLGDFIYQQMVSRPENHRVLLFLKEYLQHSYGGDARALLELILTIEKKLSHESTKNHQGECSNVSGYGNLTLFRQGDGPWDVEQSAHEAEAGSDQEMKF